MSDFTRNELFDREVESFRLQPFFPRPRRVKILMVTDGAGSFDSTADFGLGVVIELLKLDPWWWVSFEIATAHRGAGAPGTAPSTAQYQSFRFDAPPAGAKLADFQEIWLFGVLPDGVAPALGPDEWTALGEFMDEGGGLFATGDHDSLGAGLCSEVPRVRRMRCWKRGGPAGTPPPQFGTDRHDTLRAGADGRFDFDDQSDAVAQVIQPRFYRSWSPYPPGYSRHPHPLLCGRSGLTIDVLPDHMHEGEVVAPPSVAGDGEFPGGVAPEIIAWATVIGRSEGDAVDGRTFGVLGAYDGHLASVGRIAVDSTWHHWFNVNLVGFPADSSELEKIRNYFWNVAHWLAPASSQQAMFENAVYGLPHIGPLREVFRPDTPIAELGAIGLDALGRRASGCAIRSWIVERLPIELQPWFRFPVDPDPPDPPIRGPYMGAELVLGGIVQQMLKLGCGLNPPGVAHERQVIARAVDRGVAVGLKALIQFEHDSARYMDRFLKACQQQIARIAIE
ncbi:MAG TPA: hypothetical protein VNO33_22350 [Kofleriaceae bacterium]|nr:hypothetical protein [Kofleriaceae bacterium]